MCWVPTTTCSPQSLRVPLEDSPTPQEMSSRSYHVESLPASSHHQKRYAIYIYGLGYFTKLIIQPFGDSPNLNHHSSDRKRCLSFMGPLYRLHVTGTHGHLGRLEFQVPRWSFEDPNGLGSKLNVVQTKNIQTPDPINAIFAIWVLKRNMQSVQNKISLLGSPHQSCHVWVWTILKRLFNPRHIYISYDCIYTIHVGQTFANSTFDFTPGTLSILKPLSC